MYWYVFYCFVFLSSFAVAMLYNAKRDEYPLIEYLLFVVIGIILSLVWYVYIAVLLGIALSYFYTKIRHSRHKTRDSPMQ